MHPALASIVALVLFAGAAQLQAVRERWYPPALEEETAMYLRSAEADDPYALLYPMRDITTTLDPRFNIAYRFGAMFLAEPYPSGPGRPDLAIALLEKGLRERPDKWE